MIDDTHVTPPDNAKGESLTEQPVSPFAPAPETHTPPAEEEGNEPAEALAEAPAEEDVQGASHTTGQEPPPPPGDETQNEVPPKAPVQPPLETQAATPAANDKTADMGAYWNRVLTGNPATVPTDVRALAGADDDSLDPEEQNYRLLGAINRSWAVDHLGASKEAVQDGWSGCRAQLAQSLGVADNEQEVFMGLSAREQDKPRREAGRRIFEKAYLAGLKGEKNCDISTLQEGLDEADRQAAEVLGQDARKQGAEVRRKWLSLAERVARGSEAFSASEEDFFSAPRVLAAAPDLLQAVDEVAGLGEDDRETVFFLAAHLAKLHRPAEQEGLGSRLVRAVRRGAGNIGIGVAEIANHAGIVTLSNLGEEWGGETGKNIKNAAEAWDRRSTVLRRMRELTQQEIAPLYPANSAERAESYLIDAAEATPAALLAFCGGTGFAALAASGMGDSVAAARSLTPQGDHELQLAAGILGGAVQGAIYMGMGRLGGRMLEQSIANFMKTRGAGIGTFSMNALKSAGSASLHGAELIAAGKLSQAVGLGSQELAARLSGTASHIDWKSFGDNLTDIETNMREAASLLPFLLIGSGRVALRHFRSPHAVLGEGLALRDWGIDDATRLEILNAPNIDVQGSMLSEALRGSRRWSAPGFLPEIVRAMNLFNGDYFQGFRDINCVRDFLKLPPERSLLENKVIVDRDATAQEILDLEGHAQSRDLADSMKHKLKFAEVMRFWDKMYQQSHIAEYTPRYHFRQLPEGMDTPGDDRVNFYTDITNDRIPTVPYRMRNIGYYNPRGEAERRALLRDRAQECIDLSYQFMLSTFSVDSLMAHPHPMARIATHLEITRNDIIGQTANAVLDIAKGMGTAESMKKLANYIALHCERRRFRGSPPAWLKLTENRDLHKMGEFVSQYSSVTDMHHQDFKNVLRVINGLQACAQSLVCLLPMTSDFQTALTRGMSPLQAYHHLLVRELGFNPEKVKNYPLKEIEDSANQTDLEHFSQENRKIFDLAQQLSGTGLEPCVGEDGVTYWRAQRPDGGFTRWHAEQKDAVNDLVICMAPYFGKLGEGVHHWLFNAAIPKTFDLKDRPQASYREFSGFDQLCSIAMRDLGDFWHRSVTRTQPGFQPARLRTMQTGKNAKSPLDTQVQPADQTDFGVDLFVDRLGLLTPAATINGRFRVFWERAFKTGLLSVQEAGEFLLARGCITPERYRKIIDLSKQLPYPKDRNTPLRLTPPPDIAGMNREMSIEMSRFHTLYYFSHLQEQNLPESVKAWFRMAPFCPDMPEEDYRTNHRVRSGYKGLTAISWANRYTSMQLKKLAPQVEAIRRQEAEHPLPEGRILELFRSANGESEPRRYEQSWCYHYSGPGVFHGTPQKDWNLMLDPMHCWKLLTEDEKQDIRMRVGSFCADDPTQEALDAIGRGEKADYLEYALLQLDRVLKRFPDLHRYAPSTESPYAVRVVQLNDAPPERHPDAEPEMEPVPLRWMDSFDGAYSVERLRYMPDELKEDAEARSSLRFLDALRRIAIRRPYAMGNGIWWDKKIYGGRLGHHPKGLEKWQVEEPLEPLFQLLGNINKLCLDSGSETINVCGVNLRGGDWTKNDFEELATASTYRWQEDRARVYRLMPGYPDSPNVRVRTPYVVACHGGTYMNGNRVIRQTADLYHSFCPLEHFTPSHLRRYNVFHLRHWRNIALDSILESIVDRPTYLEATGNAESGIVGMGELLMRLCEDSGFSRSINPHDPGQLTREQAHIVNIATALLGCMEQQGSVKSMNDLQKAVLPLQQDPKLRHEILRTLRNSSDKVSEDSFAHSNLLEALELNWDAMEEEQFERQRKETIRDISADSGQLRQGELNFGN